MAGMKTLFVLALVGLSLVQSAPTTPSSGCGQNPADIVFLLDSSGSVTKTNFQKQLAFVSKFANSFDIGPNAVQIGVTTFSTTPVNRFWMNQHPHKADLVKAINAIPYSSGGTHTDAALNFVHSQAFTKAHGDRPKVANILIVMTDGRSQTPTQTLAAANNIKQHTNWNVFAIGIGTSVSTKELNEIATDPKHVFTVNNFDALSNIQASLKKTACEIDGKWGKWGFYSPCTKSCGGGTRYRERTCSDPPPSHGGKPCTGTSRETQACGTAACPTKPPPTTTPIPTQGTTSTVAPGCGVQPADILFIVDSSGSVGTSNFQKTLQFIETMVQGFDIGPKGIQVGMITFDNKPYLQFHLNKYSNKNDIVNAIKATKYTRGNTYTHLALQYAEGTSFTAANGARPNAAKIAIVITDGQSNNPTATKSEAQKLRNQGVTVFSVGVGSGPRTSELQAMATDPDSQHVFIVNNFDALKLIKSTLQKKACEVKPTVMATKAPPPNCGAQADLVFLLDESGSVGKTNYNKMLDFVSQIANNFAIGPKDVQVGVETFSSIPRHQFFMNKYTDKASLEAAIKKVPYHGGNTHTGDALAYLTDHSFTKSAGMRDNVPHIAFVLTDGNSQQRALTKTNAEKLQAKGVKVMAIGIGNGINNQELQNIASNPDSQYVFRATSFDSLKNLKALLSNKACEVAKPTPDNTTTPLPKTCGSKADIIFMLDSSGSVGSNNFDLLLTFVKSLIQGFDIAQDKIRIGVEKFSTRPYLEFHLNQYGDKNSVMNAIDNIKYTSGGTNTADALKYLKNDMFTTKNGDRPGVPNIGIVITDGRSNQPDQTKNMANAARAAGIQLFSVGVGNGVSMAELNEIATDPDAGHVMTVNDFSKLSTIKAAFAKKTCAVIPPTLAPYTPTPETSQAPPIDPCQDTLGDCARYPASVCHDFVQWSQHNCQRTCGICSTSLPTIPPPCEDKLDNCKSYNPSSCGGHYEVWAKENCRKYCGYCVPQAVTGYFGKCFYKGKEYNQGQKWEDGCEYECECTDASKGQYQCYNKCPAYYNLPPQCTLVKVKNDCCLKPVCDFEGSYETKSGQNVGKLNGNMVCVYNGNKYYQSQTWTVGCEFSCKCDDAGVGLWSCQSLCAQYGPLPRGCKLVQKPGDCCAKPDCEFTTQIGSFTGQGTVSGTGDKTPMTTAGPCVDVLPNCDSYAPDSCTSYKPWAIDNCRKHCNLCTEALLPGPNDFCIYKGTKYTQGQRWSDGCTGECFCDNAKYGFYRCNNACPKYYNVPPGCSLQKQAGQCCEFLSCPGGSFTGSSTVPGSIGSHPVPNPIGSPTPGPGGQTPTAAPHLTPQKLDGCMYQGTLYKVGQRWNDGCDYACSCEDGATGRFDCNPRCPSFTNLPTGCVLKDVANDPCCQYPDCTAAPKGTTVVPTYGPGFSGYGPAAYPSGLGPGFTGTGTQAPIPGQTSAPITGQRTGCLYQGKLYQAGQKWADGCTYNCECVDANTGFYRCTERCAKYPNLPSQCHMIPDPNDSCCKTYQCDFSQALTTARPLFAVTTPHAGVDYCVYNGQYYRQGEEWNDGCSLTCRCEDARNNYHQCTDRCASYTNVPLGCKLVADPKDPQCCKVPECDSVSGSVGSTSPLGFLGSFTGYGRPPNTNLPSQVGYRDACIYKGVIHAQGATWQDGCQLDCECLDAKSGKYRCTDRCARYAALPAGCTLIQDSNDRCCQKAECAPPSTSGCVDKKANCYLYGEHSCQDPYTQWAKDNCAKFCGFCGPKTTPNPLSCKDLIPNCNEYSKDSCIGDYTAWAKFNCPKYCGYCGGGPGPVTTPHSNIIVYGSVAPTVTGTGTGTCSDAISNCAQYTQSACHDPYLNWAITNCPKYCNLCDRVGTGPGATQGTVTLGGGVTGIHGSGTFNPGFVTDFPVQGYTGFNTGCYYKGRVYRTGEAWADGCEFNCTCVNGQTGYYRCIAGCQTYQNLPQGCSLIKDPGQCCATPHCSGTGTGTQTGTGTGTQTGTGTGCFYKGQNHGQGDTWKDGCDYSCTCVDAVASKYQCRQLCVSWNLPAQCSLNNPAPGKCCKTPNCPQGVTIQYPPGYKEE